MTSKCKCGHPHRVHTFGINTCLECGKCEKFIPSEDDLEECPCDCHNRTGQHWVHCDKCPKPKQKKGCGGDFSPIKICGVDEFLCHSCSNQSPREKADSKKSLFDIPEDTPEGREKVRRSTNSGTQTLSDKIVYLPAGAELKGAYILKMDVRNFISQLKVEMCFNTSVNDKEVCPDDKMKCFECQTIDKLAGSKLTQEGPEIVKGGVK